MSADDARTPLDTMPIQRRHELCERDREQMTGAELSVHLDRGELLAELEHARAEREIIIETMFALVVKWRQQTGHTDVDTDLDSCAAELQGIAERLQASAQPQPERTK